MRGPGGESKADVPLDVRAPGTGDQAARSTQMWHGLVRFVLGGRLRKSFLSCFSALSSFAAQSSIALPPLSAQIVPAMAAEAGVIGTPAEGDFVVFEKELEEALTELQDPSVGNSTSTSTQCAKPLRAKARLRAGSGR